MKSAKCLYFDSPLRKRGVERAKLKAIFRIGNSTWIWPKNESNKWVKV